MGSTICSSWRFLTSLVVFHGLLLEVLKDVRSELSLETVTVVPEQTLQTVPAMKMNKKHWQRETGATTEQNVSPYLHHPQTLQRGAPTCILLCRPRPPAAWIPHTSSCWSDRAGRRTRSGTVCSSPVIGRFPVAFALRLVKMTVWRLTPTNTLRGRPPVSRWCFYSRGNVAESLCTV